MARYAQVETASGFVVNVVEWSGDESEWRPPAGYTMIDATDKFVGPGFTYDGTNFIPPPGGEPAAPPSP